MKQIKTKYVVQKAGAKRRNIEFNLTFEQWWDIWQQSGKWEQRGCKKGQYVMSRLNDIGPYSISNVFIQQCGDNIRQAQLGSHNPRGPMTVEHKRNLSIARIGLKIKGISKLKGRPQTEEHKIKNRLAQLKRHANINKQEI
jgi:hypothetical protein